MEFRTKIEIPAFPFKINHNSAIFSIGSCFATNIGALLSESKFTICNNPYGVLYNPASIHQVMNQLLDNKTYNAKDLVFHQGLWHSLYHHGSFSDDDKHRCLEQINSQAKKASDFIHSANIIIITLGTSWIYKMRSTGEIVSNCHKIPSAEFIRERLSIEAIVDNMSALIQKIDANNQNTQFIFTVSPIRHWKDGAHENQKSKAILLLAIEKLQELFTQVHYFPSYEIVLDELRDYRFYKEDMLHPDNTAISYIWERFSETFFAPETINLNIQIGKIQRSIAHRPFNESGEAYKKHLRATIEKCKALKLEAGIDFNDEVKDLQSRLEM